MKKKGTITVNDDGNYNIIVKVPFVGADGGTTYSEILKVYINNSTMISYMTSRVIGNETTTFAFSTIQTLSADDVITLVMVDTLGVNLDASSNSEFSVYKI